MIMKTMFIINGAQRNYCCYLSYSGKTHMWTLVSKHNNEQSLTFSTLKDALNFLQRNL